MNKNEREQMVSVAATVLRSDEVTLDGVQRWAEGRGFRSVANLSDASFRKFVAEVRREQEAREQEARDLAAFRS